MKALYLALLSILCLTKSVPLNRPPAADALSFDLLSAQIDESAPAPPPVLPSGGAPPPLAATFQSNSSYASGVPSRQSLSKPNKAQPTGIPNKSGSPPSKGKLLFPLADSPLPLPAEECLTADGEVGECLSAHDCGLTNGHLAGLCHQGMDSSAYPRVCCTYQSHCGYSTSKQVSYFRSPAWPQLIPNHTDCKLEVDLNPGVCQVRLDFVDFHLAGMKNGVCSSSNQMKINTNIKHAYLPTNTLCGDLSSSTNDPMDNLRTDIPHLYLHIEDAPVDKSVKQVKMPNTPDPSITLSVKVSDYPSKWNIRVTQIQCDGAPLQAPSGCSQYYNSQTGTITSLNYNDNQYMANMDMTACVRFDQSACAIAYNISSMSIGTTRGNKLGYGLTCWDYISFLGEKTGMCGTATAREVVLPLRGSQGVSMHTDSTYSKSEVGYKMQYRYIRNCDGLQFYKYPHVK